MNILFRLNTKNKSVFVKSPRKILGRDNTSLVKNAI
jgi:hypothetical protein